MKHGLVVLSMLAALAAPSFAQLESSDATTKAKCAQYMQDPLPVEAATIPAPKQWPTCNSYRLYFGIKTKTDYAAARKCAWSERLAAQQQLEPRYQISSVLGGTAMLTVLYANGEGVPKDVPLALRLACEAEGAPAEITGRLKSLEELPVEKNCTTSKFKFCDDMTSGFMQGFCAALDEELADQARNDVIAKLTSGWPETDRRAFASLFAAELAYSEAHGRGEINLAGTARAAEEIEAERELREDFVAAIRAFNDTAFPVGLPTEAAAADKELNRIYGAAIVLAEAHKSEYGAVQPEGIQKAERAWINYRDAWTDFARVRYPAISRESWLTLLTLDRISVLKSTFCELGSQEYPCAEGGDDRPPRPLP